MAFEIRNWPPNQDYRDLKSVLLREGRLFEDPEFPANDRSLYREIPVPDEVEWKRPGEIIDNPQYIVDSATRFDLDQGQLGDCWVIAAAASLATRHQNLLNNVILPRGQSFQHGQYAGIFRFRFWRFGTWVEVVVDDRLPTQYGQLLFASNREEPNEFWVSLLEKAYAKLSGCYENIDGGNTQDALVDFTGGLSEVMSLTQTESADIYSILHESLTMNSLIACCMTAANAEEIESEETSGLFCGHAYSITAIEEVRTFDGVIHRLLRLRNPWGRLEWKEDWSDDSDMWDEVPQSVRDKLKLVQEDDGEFWMSYTDWMENFNECQLCHLSPGALTTVVAKNENKSEWHEYSYDGAWVDGKSAGGCGNPPHQDEYWTNPQYLVHIGRSGVSKTCMIVSLMEKQRKGSSGNNIAVGFDVYKVKKTGKRAPGETQIPRRHLYRLTSSGSYCFEREVTKRVKVRPGRSYVIIPSTYRPGEQAEFLLRIFTNNG